jgi:hypothetical protein
MLMWQTKEHEVQTQVELYSHAYGSDAIVIVPHPGAWPLEHEI